ncbi:THO complex subunit 4D-like [Nymphaea colorata]|nr:THO complex subunit 4D-like [Nymphaea colorata]
MVKTLDMTLEDIIKTNRRNGGARGRGRGRGGGVGGGGSGSGGGGRGGRGGGFGRTRGAGRAGLRQGPLRVNVRPSSYAIAKTFSRSKDMIWQHDLFEDSLRAAGIDMGAKLYISNLDYGVTNEDIKELFSEIGDIRHFAVHYDRSGRSTGTAEVVYSKRSDAIAAMKRYNNVSLDGKPMKIELIGNDTGVPVSARVKVTGGANGRGRRTVVMEPERGRIAGVANALNPNVGGFRGGRGRGRGRGQSRGGWGRGRGRGRGRGNAAARGGRGRRQLQDKSADDLDKELEEYHAEAMQTN